jgi:hypothetical protein
VSDRGLILATLKGKTRPFPSFILCLISSGYECGKGREDTSVLAQDLLSVSLFVPYCNRSAHTLRLSPQASTLPHRYLRHSVRHSAQNLVYFRKHWVHSNKGTSKNQGSHWRVPTAAAPGGLLLLPQNRSTRTRGSRWRVPTEVPRDGLQMLH